MSIIVVEALYAYVPYVKTHLFFVFPHSPWRIWRTPCSAPCGPCSSPGPPSSCRCRPSGPSPTPGRAGDVRRRWPRGSAAVSSPARAGSPRRSCRWGCCSAPPSDCSPANEGVTIEFKIQRCLCIKIMRMNHVYVLHKYIVWGATTRFLPATLVPLGIEWVEDSDNCSCCRRPHSAATREISSDDR